MISKLFVILVNILVLIRFSASVDVTLPDGRPVFDASLYEDALDPELCQRQLEEINNNTKLWLQFVESGLRIPRSISIGNTVDLGNYPQCIGINEEINNTPIDGKYCYLSVPVDQDVDFPLLPDWSERTSSLKGSNTVLRLVVCVPKACTVREGLVGLLRDATTFEFQYNELSCRFANDKLLAPADYVAYVVFSLLGLITILSTGYDIYHTIYLKADPKEISTLYRSFSIYTNINQITTFTKSRGALKCVDGIRSIAMMWIMLYHSFATLRIPSIINRDEARNWLYSRQSIWMTTATLSVDTFYMISGILVVYTSVNKYTGITLVKNLHMFYLNRILRMFPILAAAVLIQVSFLNHISDGPNWNAVASQTEVCRRQWWVTLLYLQNIINPSDVCLPHSWYLAVDMHMHIICPVVLFFVLGRKKNVAWSALIISLLVVLTSIAIYVFLMGFVASDIIINSTSEELQRYDRYYYRNTLARASPFFVGMIIGYILHLYRKNKLVISKYMALLLWICALSLTTLSWFGMEPMKSENWDNSAVDGFVNTFMRPAWAFGVGWIVLACVQGYGGPVNWFLSLQMWKMPSRISYAMYLLHFPLMFVFAGTRISPIYFSIESALYAFWSQFLISYVVAFFATLLIDLPFATLFKLLLGGGPRQAPTEKFIEIPENGTPENR